MQQSKVNTAEHIGPTAMIKIIAVATTIGLLVELNLYIAAKLFS